MSDLSGGLDWLKNEVEGIPEAVVNQAKTDISKSASSLWDNLRTDVGNAINKLGAAATSSAAGAVSPSGRQPIVIPLSSGQVLALVLVLGLLVVWGVSSLFRKSS
jgi:hypothetical protein